MNIGWLTLLLLLPFVGAIATMLVPGAKALLAKQVALGFSLVTLVLTAIVAIGYQRNGAADYAETYTWIKAFGAHYALGLDGVGVVLLVLTALLTPVVLIASWNDAQTSATGTGSPARSRVSTCRATAVFSPEKEKSYGASRGPVSPRGNRIAAGSPCAASRSMTGPPG